MKIGLVLEQDEKSFRVPGEHSSSQPFLARITLPKRSLLKDSLLLEESLGLGLEHTSNPTDVAEGFTTDQLDFVSWAAQGQQPQRHGGKAHFPRNP